MRILGGGGLTDSQEAQALNHYISNVDIYSNSWGPVDGYGFSEPGTITQAALRSGANNVSVWIHHRNLGLLVFLIGWISNISRKNPVALVVHTLSIS